MSSELVLFDSAREALAAAVRIDEVKDVRDHAERMKLYARQAKDKTLLANASELQLRAERRLGELLEAAKDAGEIGYGRPRSNLDDVDGEAEENGSDQEPFRRVTLKEAGIDKKLSMTAQRWAKLGDEEFEQKLEETRDKIISGGAAVVNPLRDLSTGEKKARRAEREAVLGAKLVALPEAKFGVIYADPEWEHAVWSDGGMHKAAANIYPVSGLDAIKRRDVASLAADDAVLFMWTTVPHLDQAFEVIDAWGFEYVSSAVWVKQYPGGRHGMGYWFRIDHEILIVASRGRVPAPAPGTQFPSVIHAPVREHSRKPDEAYEIIEAYFPSLPKIELNARAARPGWARWGYEAPAASSVQKMHTSPPAAEPGDGDDVRGASAASPAGEVGQPERAEARAGARFSQGNASPATRHSTFEAALPILEARYATEGGKALADELGIPLGTLRTWAFRAGLTSKARIAEMARVRNSKPREAHDAA